MSIDRREVIESPREQGVNEEIPWRLLTTPWGGTPTSVTITVYDITGHNQYDDVTSTVMPAGAASVSGDYITTPVMKALTRGHTYRVEFKFTSGGKVWEPYLIVVCRR